MIYSWKKRLRLGFFPPTLEDSAADLQRSSKWFRSSLSRSTSVQTWEDCAWDWGKPPGLHLQKIPRGKKREFHCVSSVTHWSGLHRQVTSSPFKDLPSCCTRYWRSLNTGGPAVDSQVASADHRPSVCPTASRPFSALIKVKAIWHEPRCNSVFICLEDTGLFCLSVEKMLLFRCVGYNKAYDTINKQ